MSSSRVTYRMTADRLADLAGLRVTGTAYSLTVETADPDTDATVTVTGSAADVSAVREHIGAPGQSWTVTLPETDAVTTYTTGTVINSARVVGGTIVQMGNVHSAGDLAIGEGSVILGGATVRTAPRLPLHVRARLPRGSAITVQQTTGPIRLLGHLGSAHITGTSSEVDIESADRVTVNVSTGDVHITRADAASVVTSTGDVRLTRTRTAHLSSSTGDLIVGAMADGMITARSSTGDVTVYRDGHTVMVTADSTTGDVAIH